MADNDIEEELKRMRQRRDDDIEQVGDLMRGPKGLIVWGAIGVAVLVGIILSIIPS